MLSLIERDAEIIATYIGGLHLHFREVGMQFGISAERVRQILVQHENRTGEIIHRHSRGYFSEPKPPWKCIDCHEERFYISSLSKAHGQRCQRCYRAFRLNKKTNELANALFQILNGIRPAKVASDMELRPADLLLSLTRRLYLNQRFDTLRELFSKRKTHWLKKHGIDTSFSDE